MGSIADKLSYLAGTKTAIKEAIEGKGIAVPPGTTFREYAGLIGTIDHSGGGGAGGASHIAFLIGEIEFNTIELEGVIL